MCISLSKYSVLITVVQVSVVSLSSDAVIFNVSGLLTAVMDFETALMAVMKLDVVVSY